MKKQLVTVLVAMMISPAFADHVQGHFNDKGSMAKEGKVEQLKSELGLTDDQTKKIEASREKFKPQIADLETKAKTARDRSRSLTIPTQALLNWNPLTNKNRMLNAVLKM